MRMLLLAGAVLVVAAPAFACGYNQTVSTPSSDTVATSVPEAPPPAPPKG